MRERPLERFVVAQDPVFETVARELGAGQKRSHWMWFIFPQLAGLGHSSTALHFGIENLDEARSYLKHPVLGERLRRCCRLILQHEGKTARQVLGSPDDLKFRSCLTLFLEAAENAPDRDLFGKALSAFYDGVPDDRTLAMLDRKPESRV